MFFSLSKSLSNPYAIAAAVGSFIILNTFNPAIVPASFVAYRYWSLKYAGTVITAELTYLPKYYSEISFILVNIIDEIYSSLNFFISFLY